MKMRSQFNEINEMVFDQKFSEYFPGFPESIATEMANHEIKLIQISALDEENADFLILTKKANLESIGFLYWFSFLFSVLVHRYDRVPDLPAFFDLAAQA